MIRAYFYIVVSALIWLGEGFLMTRFLAFSSAQTALLGSFYAVALLAALVAVRRALGMPDGLPADLARWRAVSVAPMATVIVGSFLSLPLALGVMALSKL